LSDLLSGEESGDYWRSDSLPTEDTFRLLLIFWSLNSIRCLWKKKNSENERKFSSDQKTGTQQVVNRGGNLLNNNFGFSSVINYGEGKKRKKIGSLVSHLW